MTEPLIESVDEWARRWRQYTDAELTAAPVQAYSTVFPSARGKMVTLGPGECLCFGEVKEHRLPAAAILLGWIEPLDGHPEPQPARLPGGAA